MSVSRRGLLLGTAVVGGGFTLLQALVTFAPISRLLYELGMPH